MGSQEGEQCRVRKGIFSSFFSEMEKGCIFYFLDVKHDRAGLACVAVPQRRVVAQPQREHVFKLEKAVVGHPTPAATKSTKSMVESGGEPWQCQPMA